MKSWPPVDSRSTRRFRRGGTHTHTHTQTNLCRQSRGLEYSRTNKSRWTHSGNHTFKDYMHIRLDRHGTGVLCTASIRGGDRWSGTGATPNLLPSSDSERYAGFASDESALLVCLSVGLFVGLSVCHLGLFLRFLVADLVISFRPWQWTPSGRISFSPNGTHLQPSHQPTNQQDGGE